MRTPARSARSGGRTPEEEGSALSTTTDTQVQVLRSYERSFPRGATVFDEGAEERFLYVIQSGEVELTRAGAKGRRTVARLGPGDFFGEMSVILGERRSARAEAATEVRLLELDGETLEAMCVERPEIAIRIIRRLTARLIEAEQRLQSMGVDDLLRPVVRALVRRAVPHGETGVRIETSLRQVASDAGLSMLETHRAVHQLLDCKLLRLADDVLFAKDVDTLTSCLEMPD